MAFSNRVHNPDVTPPDVFLQSDACERFMGRWSRRLAPRLVDLAAVPVQDSVLDVGSGTGALTFAIAEAVPTADVTGIDPSSAYVRDGQAHAPGGRIRFLSKNGPSRSTWRSAPSTTTGCPSSVDRDRQARMRCRSRTRHAHRSRPGFAADCSAVATMDRSRCERPRGR
jgi:SAM-dependent methyltransferase